MSTVATRPVRAAPIGTGQLHKALEDSRDHARLDDFCATMGCSAADVSADGIHLDILRVLDLMRARGYAVSAPIKPPHQPRRDLTTWLLDVTLPNNGPCLRLAFLTPNVT